VLAPVDLALLVAFLAWCLWSGLAARRAARQSLEQYFLAGRTLSGWQAGISMAATQYAADTPLVVTGLVATGGVFALWRLWIYAIAFLLMALLLGSAWRRARVLTDAELVELRYGRTRTAAALRALKAVYFGVVFNSAALAMVMLGATRLTEPFLLWHAWLPPALYAPVVALVERLGISLALPGAPPTASADNLLSLAALLGVTTLYSATGGLRAVVYTDVLQFAVMMIATAAYAWVVLDATGGPEGLRRALDGLFAPGGGGPGGMTREGLTAFTPDVAPAASLALVGVVAVQWIAQMNADGSGYLAQRMMACRDDREAERAGVVFTVMQILARSLLWLPIAVGLLVLFPPGAASDLAGVAEREATYVRGIVELLPAGVRGLLVTGMLAAFASTLDTHLNWGASYLTHDLWSRFLAPRVLGRAPSPRSLVWTARLGNVVVLALALALVPAMGSIQTAWQTTLLFGAGTGAVLLLRWVWWRMTAVGELCALGASIAAAPVLLLTVDGETTRLLVMAVVGTGAGVAGALLGPPVAPADLARFWERTRPPGFWGPCGGAEAAAARRRLARRTAASLGLAFSIFALLVGLGSWLLGSPPPRRLPWPGAWVGANLAVGLGTLPLWGWLVRTSGREGGGAATTA
jgi:Na+/proline symporter